LPKAKVEQNDKDDQHSHVTDEPAFAEKFLHRLLKQRFDNRF